MNYGMEEDRKAGRIAIGLVLVLVVGGGAWWYWQRSQAAAEPPPVAIEEEVATVGALPDAEPAPIQNPIEPVAPSATAEAAPPPDPDTAAQQALDEVFGATLADWLVTEQIARRLVATVDNLPRSTSIEKIRPLRPPAAPFEVQREVIDAVGGVERITLSGANHARYAPLVELLARSDAAIAAAAYRRIYPQLQAAYEDLGYPGRYFNDRLVSVIDHLLATPEPQGPLLLEQPKVLYVYADPDLEARSPGQKLLLRMGVDNTRTVKKKLREFRAQIATQAPANNEVRE
ncbi:MAG TPA: DUF3014 domain-containing protein [Steroidobacteraceae bacterium]|nr:DUF3014 domain-containing protein [Steroidobacteraceae bacterium]